MNFTGLLEGSVTSSLRVTSVPKVKRSKDKSNIVLKEVIKDTRNILQPTAETVLGINSEI